MTEQLLASWADTPTRSAITDFVAAVTRDRSDAFVPPADRIAVVVNDGTLCARSRSRSSSTSRGRPYLACADAPMIELLRYLEANGFTTHIASGGDRDFPDDAADKPIRICSRIGRRPLVAGDNSNGDVQTLRLALDRARERGWTIVSMRDDWTRIFVDG